MRLAVRPHHLCRSRSPDLDPIGIRRSRTTEGARCLPVGGTSLSRYGGHRERWARCLSVGGTSLSRYGGHRDQEGSPTDASRPGGLSYREVPSRYETPSNYVDSSLFLATSRMPRIALKTESSLTYVERHSRTNTVNQTHCEQQKCSKKSLSPIGVR